MKRREFISSLSAAAAGLRFGPIWAAAAKQGGTQGVATIAECETLFLGASAYACARAWTQPETTVILENSLLMVGEFSGALWPIGLKTAQSEAAKAFVARFEKEQLVAGGKYHPPPVSDAVVAELTERNANFFLNGTLVKVTKSGGRFSTLVFGIDGLNRIVAKHVVDTTSVGWRDSGTESIAEKFICAPLFGNADCAAAALRGADYETFDGALPGERTLKVKIAADADWHAARLKLYDVYERLAAGPGKGLQIGGEATQLGVVYKTAERISEVTPEGILWHPGAQYPDIVSAFEEGASC